MKTSRYNNNVKKLRAISSLISKHVFEYGYDNGTTDIDRVYEWVVRLDKYHNELKAMQRYYIKCFSPSIDNADAILHGNRTLTDLYYNLSYISDRFRSLNRIQLLIDTPKIYGELVNTFIGCDYKE